MVALPDLGVGLTYSSAMEPFLAAHGDLVDVIEFEPQTTWLPVDHGGEARPVDEAIRHITLLGEQLGLRSLVHSINCPVGGTSAPDPRQVDHLRTTITRLGSPWVSEHLSFNRVGNVSTGFFLPPRQTEAGVDVAAGAVRRLRADLGVPLAFETGVNYLAPRPDEMDDGDFIALVAEQADSGILLDLHNVYTNAVNGRQPLARFLEQLPLERVWEIHLAGGFELDGFWLDAHSGPMPQDLVGLTVDIIGDLPNLKAIIFEMYPAFAGHVGDDAIARQLEFMHRLWELRRPSVDVSSTSPSPSHPASITVAPAAVAESNECAGGPDEWERELATLTVGGEADGELGCELAADPGVALVRRLSLEFRASMISTNLRRTTRLLLLALGEPVMRMLLEEYRRRVTPAMFGLAEARAFAAFLRELDVGVPQLMEVLAFEEAVLESLADGRDRLLRFDFDPLPMLTALSDGRLPDEPGRLGDYEIEITADIARTLVA